MRYTASLLMPLSALLSVAGALYGHHVIGYAASILHLAQVRSCFQHCIARARSRCPAYGALTHSARAFSVTPEKL